MSEDHYQPQYMRIYQSVRNDIIDGRLSPGKKLPSIRSFSKQWSVSNITIVKAFDMLKEEALVTTSERSGFYVAERMQREVAAKKIGFLSPVQPQDMHKQKHIHLACSRLQKSLHEEGHYLSVHLARWAKPGGVHQYLSPQAIEEYGLDAIILIHIYDYHYLSSLTKLDIPIVLIDADASHLGIDSVFFDNTMAAMHLCNVLIEQGHSDILYVGGPRPHVLGQHKKVYYDPATAQREDGCHLAASIKRLGQEVRIHSAYALETRSGEEWANAANAYLREHPEVDAIVAECPLQLEPAFAGVKQVTFSSSRDLSSVGAVAAHAVCDYSDLMTEVTAVLKRRFESPYAPTVRHATVPQIVMRNEGAHI